MRNPAALLAAPVQELFARAYEAERFADAKEVMAHVAENIHRDDFAVFIVRNDLGGLVGLTIVESDCSVFSELPWVLHIYSAGGRRVTHALAGAIRDWLMANGHTHVRVLNQTGRSDAEHMRIFAPFGSGTVLGGVIDYKLTPKG
jgi:hypothetical protein